MKRHLKLFTVIIIIFLVISVSINVALAVTTTTTTPGSDQDPIVSKSYVDSAVSQLNLTIQALLTQIATFQTDNEKLKEQVASQNQLIATMQEDIKKINTQLAITGSNTNNNTTPTTVSTGTVNTLSLNIRSKASTTASTLGSLKKGEVVTIISKSGDWLYIKTSKNLIGYVFAKFVTLK